jgi:hypothetical protein
MYNHDIDHKARTDNRGDQIERHTPIVTTRIQAPLTPVTSVHQHVSVGKEPVQSRIKPPQLHDAIARPVADISRVHPFAAMLHSRLDRRLRLHTCDAYFVIFGNGVMHQQLSK